MKLVVAAVFWVLLPAGASAEIVAWVDSQGVQHYTNVPEDIPPDYRDSVRTVVKDMPLAEEPPPAPPTRRELDRPARRRLAQVVFDRPERSEDYMRGFVEGIAQVQGRARAGDINIQGPLAVARADARAPYVATDPYYTTPIPFVTTAFDRGRSRHQTLRMWLQDRFQLDRGFLPYVYPARFRIPRRDVGLTPYYNRGLPRRLPRKARGRVLRR